MVPCPGKKCAPAGPGHMARREKNGAIAATYRDGVNVEVAAPVGTVGQGLTVGTPAMQVAGTKGSDQAGAVGALQRQGIDARLPVFARGMAHGNLLAVGRKYVVVVATVGIAGVYQLRIAGIIGRHLIQFAATVVNQPPAIVRPVGCLDKVRELGDHRGLPRCAVHHLQDACHLGLRLGLRHTSCRCQQEKRRIQNVFHCY